MRRLGGRALLAFGIWIAVILAVIGAGFIGQRVGIWAAVLWGVLLVGVLVAYRRRSRLPQTRSTDGRVRAPEGPRYLPSKPAKLKGDGKSAAEYVSEGRR